MNNNINIWKSSTSVSFLYVTKTDEKMCYGISLLKQASKWAVYLDDRGYSEDFHDSDIDYSRTILSFIFSKVIQYDSEVERIYIYL